jgi:hypothetical protein
MLSANASPYRMFLPISPGQDRRRHGRSSSMQVTGDVVPTFAAGPARRGWRAVLGRLAVIAFVVLQGLRLGLAFKAAPLPVLLGGELIVYVLIAVLAHRKIVRQGAVTSAVAARSLVMLGVGLMVFLSVGVAIGRAIPGDSKGNRYSRAIPGAPGYTTYYGQHGLPIAVDRPWGKACTPVRFTIEPAVSAEIRTQVLAVVAEARRAGLNVTLEDAQGMWIDDSVYYPAGMTSADVVDVYIGVDDNPSYRLANGRMAQVAGGYDSKRDGRQEDFSSMVGRLRLRVVGGNPTLERVAVREIVSMSQGIRDTPTVSSGMYTGTPLDAFTLSDIAAMRLMSGCGTQALATVSNPAFNPAGNP